MRFSTLLNMQKFVKGSLSTEVGFRIAKVIINTIYQYVYVQKMYSEQINFIPICFNTSIKYRVKPIPYYVLKHSICNKMGIYTNSCFVT